MAFFKAFSGESGTSSHLLNEASYLAFLRMIGVKKHRSCFLNYDSPIAHFNSHKSNTIKQQHLNWIDS